MSTSKKTLEDYLKGKEPNFESAVEGIGRLRVYGELDLEKLVRKLLKSSYFCGGARG
ncbi:hypothetical protein [Peribacillus kribbensis]|uniref:hypothetical protein n=1 Tax=Peribacillus kribbensis TaxID=356658 RepID=UPI0004124386|nr:hypothetical protein [Peribacillus kribbensis]